MAEDIGLSRLPLGAKILWERVAASRTLTLGFFFATGSRFDPPGKAGVAHLVEHLVFKGTRNHSASSLARLVDRVGGDLNAWTDREEVAFTCSVPAESWPVAVEALTELCLHPTFPVEEFAREKEVIRNEILSSLEDPEELSYDHYLAATSPGDWSRPVAGTEATLEAITLDDARAWWSQYLSPGRLTVALSGGVDPGAVQAAVARSLEEVSAGPAPEASFPVPEAREPARFAPVPRVWIQKAPFQMVQIVAGFVVPEPTTSRQAAVWQIFSMLWGETMSSRLFQAVRESRGLCYSVTSQVFDAEGAWGLQVFATCAPENVAPLLAALKDEIDRLATEPPSASEWDDGRMALRGGVVLGAERTENRVGRLWRQHESFGEVLGADATVDLLATPVSVAEADAVLEVLRHQKPSLLVWGRSQNKLLNPWLG